MSASVKNLAEGSVVMSDSLFERIDAYIDGLFVPADGVLDAAVARARAAGMPEIQVSAGQGKLLYLLAKLVGARRILELGTLAGYSTIWLARAVPADGRVVTLEFSPTHAKVARENISGAGLADRVEVMVGAALDTLPKLSARGEPKFDLVFMVCQENIIPPYGAPNPHGDDWIQKSKKELEKALEAKK